MRGIIEQNAITGRVIVFVLIAQTSRPETHHTTFLPENRWMKTIALGFVPARIGEMVRNASRAVSPHVPLACTGGTAVWSMTHRASLVQIPYRSMRATRQADCRSITISVAGNVTLGSFGMAPSARVARRCRARTSNTAVHVEMAQIQLACRAQNQRIL